MSHQHFEIERIRSKDSVSNEIVLAKEQKKFIQFADSEKIIALENILKTAYFDSGKSIDGASDYDRQQHIKALATRLNSLIPEQFKNITGAEIRLACRYGAIGKYGEFYSISPITVIDWIKNYISERGQFTLNKPVNLLPESTPPTEDEWNAKMKTRLIECWNQVQKGLDPVDYGNILFKFLREKKIIEFTEDEITQFMELGKAKVIADNDPNDAKSLGERIEKRNLIKLIMQTPKNTQVVIAARNIALKEFLMFIDDIESITTQF